MVKDKRFVSVQQKIHRYIEVSVTHGTKSFSIVESSWTKWAWLDSTIGNDLVPWGTGTSRYFFLDQSKSLYYIILHLTILVSTTYFFNAMEMVNISCLCDWTQQKSVVQLHAVFLIITLAQILHQWSKLQMTKCASRNVNGKSFVGHGIILWLFQFVDHRLIVKY